MKDVELYTYELINHRFCVIGLLNNQQIVLDDITFATAGQAQNYIYDNHVKLSKKVLERYKAIYGPIPSSKNIKTENESQKRATSSKKTTKKKTAKKKVRIKKESINEKFTIRQLIAVVLAFIMLAVTPFVGWLLSHISKKNKNYVPAKNDDVLNLITETPSVTNAPVVSMVPTLEPTVAPTEEITETPTVVPTEEPVTVEVINAMSTDILNEYMSINPSVSNMQVISNGELVGMKVTESEIKNAIILLNINDLSTNHNDVFRELVGNQQPDAMYQNNQFLMCNLVALNMQEYYANHSTKSFVWFSPMLMNKDDKADMQVIEGYVKRLCDDSLAGKNCNSLMNEFINVLDNQMMLNRGNGFDSILVMYLELVNNTCQNSITNNQRNTIKDIEDWKQESSYVGTMNILNSVHNYGCAISGYSRKRIRNV